MKRPPRETARCDRRFFAVDAVTLARRLLGQRLVRISDAGQRLSGLIVETEAYVGVQDLASHAVGGRRTARNEAMYGPAGTSYVYFTYGMHHCFNIVCGQENEPAAVLIRALEPVDGEATMRSTLKLERRDSTNVDDLCRGPGRLCRSLGIDRTLNGRDLTTDAAIWVERVRVRAMSDSGVGVSPRVGIDFAGAWRAKPLRFFVERSRSVSGPRRARQKDVRKPTKRA